MPIATAPTLETERTEAVVRARLDATGANGALVERYLDTLTPARWTIEWHLPSWLARRLGLSDEIATELVESNGLGLLSVRVADDLSDGDVAPEDLVAATALAETAFELALQPYRALFPAASPFWVFLDRTMRTWRAGADGADHAERAEPIKVAAYACCLLAERTHLWPRLERCLDAAMTALVLYDQFFDWEADVDAGRWNAFVAGIVAGAQSRAGSDRTRAAVLTAMLTRDVVGDHFRRIAAAAELATRLAVELELPDLASYLREWADDAAAQGREVEDHYRRAAERATRLLFPDAVGTQVRGGRG